MDKRTSTTSACVIGIDLGRKTSHAAVVLDGRLLEEFTIMGMKAAFTKAFESRERCRVVIEVCGSYAFGEAPLPERRLAQLPQFRMAE